MTAANQIPTPPPGAASANSADMYEGGGFSPENFAGSIEYARYVVHRYKDDKPYQLKFFIKVKPLDAAADGVEASMLESDGCVHVHMGAGGGKEVTWLEGPTFVPATADGVPTILGNEERLNEEVTHGVWAVSVDSEGNPTADRQLRKNSSFSVLTDTLIECGFDPKQLNGYAPAFEGLHVRLNERVPHWATNMEPRMNPKTGQPYPPFKCYHVVEILKTSGIQGVEAGNGTSSQLGGDPSLDSWLFSVIGGSLDGSPKDPSTFANAILAAHSQRPPDVSAELGLALTRAVSKEFLASHFNLDGNGQILTAKG